VKGRKMPIAIGIIGVAVISALACGVTAGYYCGEQDGKNRFFDKLDLVAKEAGDKRYTANDFKEVMAIFK
jgi:hypothetical protein